MKSSILKESLLLDVGRLYRASLKQVLYITSWIFNQTEIPWLWTGAHSVNGSLQLPSRNYLPLITNVWFSCPVFLPQRSISPNFEVLVISVYDDPTPLFQVEIMLEMLLVTCRRTIDDPRFLGAEHIQNIWGPALEKLILLVGKCLGERIGPEVVEKHWQRVP